MPSTSDPAVSICTDARSRWRLATWGENSPPICLLSPTCTAAAAAMMMMMLLVVLLLQAHKGDGSLERKITAEVIGEKAVTVTWQVAISDPTEAWWGEEGGWFGERRRTPSNVPFLLQPRPLSCPLSCTLLTSRAVTGLSEPITGRHAACQPRTSLDRMTSNFWCWVSRTIWKQMSSLLVRRARHKYKLCSSKNPRATFIS